VSASMDKNGLDSVEGAVGLVETRARNGSSFAVVAVMAIDRSGRVVVQIEIGTAELMMESEIEGIVGAGDVNEVNCTEGVLTRK
jgi:hypothetical protein